MQKRALHKHERAPWLDALTSCKSSAYNCYNSLPPACEPVLDPSPPTLSVYMGMTAAAAVLYNRHLYSQHCLTACCCRSSRLSAIPCQAVQSAASGARLALPRARLSQSTAPIPSDAKKSSAPNPDFTPWVPQKSSVPPHFSLPGPLPLLGPPLPPL